MSAAKISKRVRLCDVVGANIAAPVDVSAWAVPGPLNRAPQIPHDTEGPVGFRLSMWLRASLLVHDTSGFGRSPLHTGGLVWNGPRRGRYPSPVVRRPPPNRAKQALFPD
jgi:hypothetical protein